MLVMPKSDARWIYQLGTRGPGLALKQGLDLDLESMDPLGVCMQHSALYEDADPLELQPACKTNLKELAIQC